MRNKKVSIKWIDKLVKRVEDQDKIERWRIFFNKENNKINNHKAGLTSKINFVLFTILLVLKLTNTIAWSWWIITLPLWIGFVFAVGVLLIIFLICLIIFFAYFICILIKWIFGGRNGINTGRIKG